MKINVEFTSLSDMATFTKFINDSLVPPTQKQKTISSIQSELTALKESKDKSDVENEKLKALLVRAYERLKIADPKGETANYDMKQPVKQPKKQDIALDVLKKKIKELDLTVRSHNCLASENIYTIGDLVSKTTNELLKIPNLGRKSIKEIEEVLANKFGLTLR